MNPKWKAPVLNPGPLAIQGWPEEKPTWPVEEARDPIHHPTTPWARDEKANVIAFVCASCLQLQLAMFYTRCGETSERHRTAVPVAYGIECSVIMRLKWTDEVEVSQETLLLISCAGYSHPLPLRYSQLQAPWRFSQHWAFVSVSARVNLNGNVNATEDQT